MIGHNHAERIIQQILEQLDAGWLPGIFFGEYKSEYQPEGALKDSLLFLVFGESYLFQGQGAGHQYLQARLYQ